LCNFVVLFPEFIEVYKGTVVEKVLIFKERLWDIFDNSNSSEEARSKRDELYKDPPLDACYLTG